ncbi:hypothetical protein MJT46_012276 [Ovis ammon polii x Ovis aries]|nr:hypothetical protein MJT46_012276 [Ovis ammon polii x Ovis aries]
MAFLLVVNTGIENRDRGLLKVLGTFVACVIFICISNTSLYLHQLALDCALILWQLYRFCEEFGGQPQQSRVVNCSNELTYTICTMDRGLAVAILTFINLLVYVAKLVYWAYHVSVGSQDVSSAPDCLVLSGVSTELCRLPMSSS